MIEKRLENKLKKWFWASFREGYNERLDMLKVGDRNRSDYNKY